MSNWSEAIAELKRKGKLPNDGVTWTEIGALWAFAATAYAVLFMVWGR